MMQLRCYGNYDLYKPALTKPSIYSLQKDNTSFAGLCFIVAFRVQTGIWHSVTDKIFKTIKKKNFSPK